MFEFWHRVGVIEKHVCNNHLFSVCLQCCSSAQLTHSCFKQHLLVFKSFFVYLDGTSAVLWAICAQHFLLRSCSLPVCSWLAQALCDLPAVCLSLMSYICLTTALKHTPKQIRLQTRRECHGRPGSHRPDIRKAGVMNMLDDRPYCRWHLMYLN